MDYTKLDDRTKLNLNVFEAMQTGICIVNAYPYKGYWCNSSWLKVWECKYIEDWYESTSKTMDNWSYSTHLTMKELYKKVQINKEKTYNNYTIYRNGVVKKVSVCQRPFQFNNETLVLYEHIPSDKKVDDISKRTMEGFKYTLSILTMFNLKGEIILQNPLSESYYNKELLKIESEKSELNMLQYIIGNQELYNEIFKSIINLGIYNGTVLQANKLQGKKLRRIINASYGLDPVTSQKMIMLSENYLIEPLDIKLNLYKIIQNTTPSEKEIKEFIENINNTKSFVRISSLTDMNDYAINDDSDNDYINYMNKGELSNIEDTNKLFLK